jgi:hypothetical protein
MVADEQEVTRSQKSHFERMQYSQASRGLMQRQRWEWLVACRTIVTAAAIWVFLGVPVAAAITGVVLLFFVVLAVPVMAATAAVLGAAQGLCLVVASRWSRSRACTRREADSAGIRWFGAISGGVLGLLGFLPVYSHTSIVVKTPAVYVFLVAGISAGAVAGTVCCWKLPVKLLSPPTPRRTFAVGSLVVLALAAIGYGTYWDATVDRLPVPEVSKNSISQLSAGNAKGSVWSGCYDYRGTMSQGSGMTGFEGGLLIVKQNDGLLAISSSRETNWHGGVNESGRFRAGVETNYGQDTLRTLWEGRFASNSFNFTKRDSLVRDGRLVNTTKAAGTAQRISCN